MKKQKLKPFPNYKSSGIVWIGDIPESWEIRRFKTIMLEPLKYGANESSEYDNPDWPRYIRITDFDDAGNLKMDTFKSLPYRKAYPFLLCEGDILFARCGATVGKSFHFKNCHNIACYAGYLINAKINPKIFISDFVFYFTRSFSYEFWKDMIFIKSTIENISANKYKELRIPFPQLKEQQFIVDFLDRETARINAMVEKQNRLIALLKEKRSALITQTVTKGLNPKDRMKPSGVEWIGEIPEGWVVRKVKFIVNLIKDKNKQEKGHDNFKMSLENIESYTGRYIETESSFEGDSFYFCDKDILYSKLRPYLCKVYLPDKNGLCVGEILVMRSKLNLSARRFIFYLFISNRYTEIVDGSTFGAKMPRVDWQFIGNIYIPLPPLPEQQAIVDFLDKETAKSDNLIGKIEKQISLLNEYKQSLITAAVTGKIDVRGEANASNS